MLYFLLLSSCLNEGEKKYKMKIKKTTSFLKSLLIILILSIWGCHSKNGKEINNEKQTDNQILQNSQFLTIDFPEILKQKREVPISEIAGSVDYISLEKTPKSLIGSILDAYITKEYIFIQHNGSPLLTQFSRDGQFVRQIGSEGRGPKEYMLIRQFSIDETNELIYIHTNWTRKILVYSFSGDYVKTIKYEGIGRGHITWCRDSLFVSFSEPHAGNESYVLLETDSHGDTIQGVKNHIFWNSNESSHYMVSYWGQNSFYWADEKLHMKGWYNDTVYTYDSEYKIVPKYFIDLKVHKLPADKIPERNSLKSNAVNCYWTGVNESSDYIFIRFGLHWSPKSKKEEQGCMFVNKKTGVGTALINKGEDYGFVNDLDAGPDFKPEYSNDTLAYSFITAMDYKEYIGSDNFQNRSAKFPDQKEKHRQLNKTLKEDDNHILVLANLK